MRALFKRQLGALLVVAGISIVLFPAPASAALAGAPTGLTATPADVSAVLSWAAPVSNGGEAISTYNVEYSADNGVTWSLVVRSASTSLTYTVLNLTNGTRYLFRVSAVNNSGAGPVSNQAAATPFVVHTPNDPALFSACPTGVIASAGFTDTTSTDVDCIYYYGITKGLTPTTYSPNTDVTRWQMALFLTRLASKAGITLGTGTAQGFTDISNKSTEIQTAINQLKQLGITTGTTATTYSPDNNVTREQMALFITRLLKKATVGPGGNTEFITGTTGVKEIKSNDSDHNYTDMPVGLMESRNAIINLWNLGVTDRQTATTYEPAVNITRASMATFMTNALAHTNARPKGLVLQASGYRVKNGTAVNYSVSHRTDDFTAISGSLVDTFQYIWSQVTTATRFDTAGYCNPTYVTVTTSYGTTMCQIDASDKSTDVYGNIPTFMIVPPNINNVDIWAWTAPSGTRYDNDLHASAASKITVRTHS